MLTSVIGDILPSALAIGLSPIPIVAVVLILGTERARSNGIGFAMGWVSGLVVIATLVILLTGDAADPESTTATGINWAQVGFGLLFLVMAVRKWQSRPQPGSPTEMPSWMASIGQFTPGRSTLFGAALSGANPKNLVLTLAGAAAISQAGLTGSEETAALAVFVGIASLAVLGLVGFALIAPVRAAAPLSSVKTFMADNNAVIMMVVLLLIGAQLLGKGLGAIG